MDTEPERVIHVKDAELFAHIEEVLTTQPDPERVAWFMKHLVEIDEVK